MTDRRSDAAQAQPVRRGPGRPPGPSQAAQLRARLLGAASELYAAGGYAGLSFAVVAERTDLTKATVFHYFPNKEAVVYAVFDALGQRLEQAALGWFDAPPESYAERLERVIGALVDFYGADPINARILCHGLLEAEHIMPSRVVGTDAPPVFGHFVQRFVTFLEGGVAAGEFVAERPWGTMMSIGGVIMFECMLPGTGTEFIHRSDPQALAERKREVIDFVRRAVVRPAARLRRG